MTRKLKTLVTRKGLDAPLQDLGYDWYQAANTGGINVGSITDNRGAGAKFCPIPNPDGTYSNTSETQAYVYDDIYRLWEANGVWGLKTYHRYNSIGNPEEFGGLVQRNLVFVGQQVQSGTGLSGVTYDAAGNMRHKVLDGVTWDYDWTAENRLASISKNGWATATMIYDAGGQRVKKIYSPQGGSSVTTLYVGNVYEKRTYGDGSPERHTIHLLGNGNLVASITRAGVIATAFQQANGWRTEVAAASLYDAGSLGGALRKADHLLNAAARHPSTSRWLGGALFALFAAAMLTLSLRGIPKKRRARRWSPQLRWASLSLALLFTFTACSGGPDGRGRGADPLLTGDTTRGPPVGTQFYHRNHINSSSVITDGDGVETARIVYVPFGEFSRDNSCGSDVVSNKFTGKEYDEESNLYYYGARYYDPAIGRFVSADPVVPSADSQSFNRYSYVNNNPIVYVDPTGHFLDFIGDFFNAIGRGFQAIGNAITAGIRWLGNVLAEVGKFLGKVGEYAWATIQGMLTNPAALIGTLMSVALPAGGGTLLMALAAWGKGMAVGIAATSIAQAAGVRDPLLLTIIGTAAGLVAAGSDLEAWLKAGAKTGLSAAAKEAGGSVGAVFELAEAVIVNDGADASGESDGLPMTSPGDLEPIDRSEIIIIDPGGRYGPAYGGTMIIVGADGEVAAAVPASSWPNPNHAAPGIAEGRYWGIYSPKGHLQTYPGVRVYDGGRVPTLGPNPVENGNSYATGVNIHKGHSSTWRGSTNCLTIKDGFQSQAWNALRTNYVYPIRVLR
jgi:RHS repeat-associated protein